MADYVLSAKGTYDGSDFDSGIDKSREKLSSFMEEAGAVGRRITSVLGSGFVSAADGITSSIGQIGAGITALAATGGIRRALNLEQAEHMFDGIGLGWQTLTDKISESTGEAMTWKDVVNDAVLDTQYSLDEAAVVAAQLAAAGVTSGEKMATVLDTITGTASTFGAELSSIGDIFQRVAARGKVSGEEIARLSERGVPALATLANYFGVTQEEMADMVKKGEVSFDEFSAAMNDAFGGTAKTANDTFVGALSNVRAALSRIGAKFATPGLDALKNIFNALRPLINAVSSALDPLVDKFTKFLGITEDGTVQAGGAVEKLITFIDNLTEKVKALGEGGFTNLSNGAKLAAAAIGLLTLGSIGGLISQIPILGSALGGIFGVFSKLATPVGSLVGSFSGLQSLFIGISAPAMAIVVIVGSLIAAFTALMITNDEFREKILSLVAGIVEQLQPAFETMVSVLLPALQSLFMSLMNAVELLAPAILGLVDALAPLIATVIETVAPALARIIELIGPLIERIAEGLVPIIETLGEIVKRVLPAVQQHFEDTMGGMMIIVETAWPYIERVISDTLGTIQAVLETVLSIMDGDWEGAFTHMKEFSDSTWNGIWDVIEGVLNLILGLFGTNLGEVAQIVGDKLGEVKNWFDDMEQRVTSTVSSLWNDVTSAFWQGVDGVINAVRGIPDTIMGFFSNAGDWLYYSGQSVIQGFVNGIWGAIDWAASSVSNAIDNIRWLFPFSPAKKGPFSGRGWVLYSGMSVMDAFGEGASREADNAVSAIEDVVGKVRGAMDFSDMSFDAQANVGSLPLDLAGASRRTQEPAGGQGFGGVSISIGEMVVRDRSDADYFAEILYKKWSREEAGAL